METIDNEDLLSLQIQFEELVGVLAAVLNEWLPSAQRRINQLETELRELKDERLARPRVYQPRTYETYVKFCKLRNLGYSIRRAGESLNIPYSSSVFYERCSPEDVATLKARADRADNVEVFE